MGSCTAVKWKGWSVHSEWRSHRSRQVWRSGCRAVENSGWTACAGSIIGMCTGQCCSMDRLRPQTVFRKKIEMLRLHSYPYQAKTLGMRKNWRTIALLSHIGNAWAKASVRPLVPAVAKVAVPCQFGSLPGRSKRDAVAILENVFERFTNSNHKASRRSCLLAGFLFDLERAFDTTPRDRPWAAVSDAAKLKGLSVILEAVHAGTCHIIRNSLGRPVTKVHVTMGVRQGSVEGPLCFILLYALSITHSSTEKTSATESHCGGSTWEHSEQIGPV